MSVFPFCGKIPRNAVLPSNTVKKVRNLFAFRNRSVPLPIGVRKKHGFLKNEALFTGDDEKTTPLAKRASVGISPHKADACGSVSIKYAIHYSRGSEKMQ